MGNHKGPSNGCKTCIQRRVKCDQSRPECTRCIAAKFTCLGYRESFIDGRQQVLRQINRKAAYQPKTPSSLTLISPQPHHDHVPISDKSNKLHYVPWDYQELSVSPSLSLSAWKADFFLSHLTSSIAGPMATLCYNLAIPSYRPDSLLKIATKECFLALATTFFGASQAQQSFVQDGRRLYGRGLSMVSITLKRSSASVTEILSAVFALCLHEAIDPTCDDQHSWLNHIWGLEKLFAINGPPSTKNQTLYSEMLELTRFVMIVAALHGRRPSLMAQPEWSAFGQFKLSNEVTPVSEMVHILDTLAHIPTLYYERDILAAERNRMPTLDITSEGDAYGPRVQTLLDRSAYLLNDVRCKRNQWKSCHLEEAFSTLSQTSFTSLQPRPCTVATRFSSLSATNIYTLYATILILLNNFIDSMDCLLPLTEVQKLATHEEISSAVFEILRSIDSYLRLALTQPTRMVAIGASPSNFFLLPVRVAHHTLSRSKLEEDVSRRLWLEEVVLVIKRRSGLQASNIQLFNIGRK